MIAVRVKTAKLVKDMQFEDHKAGNAFAKKVLDVLGRPEEYRERLQNGAIITIASELSVMELHDKGISFFGATHPTPLKHRTKKIERPKRAKKTKKN